MEKFGLSEKQATAILDMRLRRLTGLERDKLEQDYKDVLETIDYLTDLLSSRDKLMGVVRMNSSMRRRTSAMNAVRKSLKLRTISR